MENLENLYTKDHLEMLHKVQLALSSEQSEGTIKDQNTRMKMQSRVEDGSSEALCQVI